VDISDIPTWRSVQSKRTPKGPRNKRTQEILDLLHSRGDKDPLDALSDIITKNQDPAIVASCGQAVKALPHSGYRANSCRAAPEAVPDNPQLHYVRSQGQAAAQTAFRPSVFDGHVTTLCEAHLAQALMEPSHTVRPLRCRHAMQHAYQRHSRLLRVCCQRRQA
jgi:hypothetical protein